MQLTPMSAVLGAMALLGAGSVAALALSVNRRLCGWVSFMVIAAAGALTVWASAASLAAGGADSPVVLASCSLWGSTLGFSLDGLSAIFTGLIAVISTLAGFYSISYMDHYRDYHVARYYPWFLLFIAGMLGIVTVTDTVVFFFLFWQLMTIPSYALIRYEYRKSENVRAANKYLIVMEIAGLLVAAGSIVLGMSGPVHEGAQAASMFDFESLRNLIAGNGVAAHTVSLALILMLLGFAVKAGVWPFGALWLPDAHPAAPSPVSALLSGVMIKTGIYGMIRTLFWLVPDPGAAGFSASVGGGIIAVLGTITLVLGTYDALKQEQTKRLLAFHSIGQVGYIVLGLGASLMLLPAGLDAGNLATLALVGALFHTINHAIFKSLLFFNAGTMLKATDTQDLNRLGGLFTAMPLTAITCLIASFSIAGVPLFNGFASKWTIYVATVTGGPYAPLLVLCGLFGILTSALTLGSFMKFFGVSFLSRKSTVVTQRLSSGRRLEAGFTMQVPQLVLAVACLGLGILPSMGYSLIAGSIAKVSHGIVGALPAFSPESGNSALGITAGDGAALFVPLVIGSVIIILMVGAHVFSRLGSAPRRKADIWLCGYDAEADIHRYGAHNLYGEVKHLFGKKH
jgi:formate hydrogenlyase subunit 3/multisubunit Na+/H+ antiporter MnhD subunit